MQSHSGIVVPLALSLIRSSNVSEGLAMSPRDLQPADRHADGRLAAGWPMYPEDDFTPTHVVSTALADGSIVRDEVMVRGREVFTSHDWDQTWISGLEHPTWELSPDGTLLLAGTTVASGVLQRLPRVSGSGAGSEPGATDEPRATSFDQEPDGSTLDGTQRGKAREFLQRVTPDEESTEQGEADAGGEQTCSGVPPEGRMPSAAAELVTRSTTATLLTRTGDAQRAYAVRRLLQRLSPESLAAELGAKQ